jgi:Zn-finger protein
MMNCPRCNGLAVNDYSIDQQAGPSSGFHVWRCVNCGMISDDVIHENQLAALALRKHQRQRLPRSRERAQMLSLRH